MTRAFPLAGLLRLRSLAEDQAAAELGLARRDQAAAERRARDTAAELPARQSAHFASLPSVATRPHS